jgi:two-component system, NtrC family, sensor kinase
MSNDAAETFLTDRSLSDEEVEQALIEEIDRVLGDPPRRSFAPGELIVRSNEALSEVIILTEGKVRLSRTEDGDRSTFHIRTAGRIIGLIALSLGTSAFFDVEAETEVTAIPVSYTDLNRALVASPTLAGHFTTVLLRSFARRAVRAVEQHNEIELLNTALESERDRLRATLQELAATQTRLVESEKLATLGELAAGIGHELNNPIAAIVRSVDFLKEDVEGLLVERHPGDVASDYLHAGIESSPLPTSEERRRRTDLEAAGLNPGIARRLVKVGVGSADEYAERFGALDPASVTARLDDIERFYDLGLALRNIGASAGRIADLVGSLRTYARSGRELSSDIDVNAGLEDTLMLLGHRAQGIDIVRDYGELPTIEGYAGKLNQVWTNLIVNALQAMGGSGKLTVRSDVPEPGYVRVQIIDSGPGIAAEHIEKVFDLRFTTRQGRVEFGLGLGLRISQDIVAQHDGTIEVESKPGRTCFTVVLPTTQPEQPGAVT